VSGSSENKIKKISSGFTAPFCGSEISSLLLTNSAVTKF